MDLAAATAAAVTAAATPSAETATAPAAAATSAVAAAAAAATAAVSPRLTQISQPPFKAKDCQSLKSLWRCIFMQSRQPKEQICKN